MQFTLRKDSHLTLRLSRDYDTFTENLYKERLGVLAATCAARLRLPLCTSAIRRA